MLRIASSSGTDGKCCVRIDDFHCPDLLMFLDIVVLHDAQAICP